jgi:hypothetical protein
MSNDQHHHHHHDHESQGELSFEEKMAKLLEHWIKHNQNHASNYRNWAEKAKANGKETTGKFLLEAAQMSLATNDLFEKALAELGGN